MKLFDATLGTLENALDVRLARQNVLATNVANVDTPGYVPRELDFDRAMQSADAGLPDLKPSGRGAGLDGNGVDLDRTLVDLAENALQYGAAARTASKKLAILRYVASDGAA